MSFSRRKFLSSAAVASTGLLLPSFVRQANGQLFTKIGATFVPLDSDSLNLLKKSLATTQKLPTADSCLICQKSIEEIGGQKLVFSHFRGTTIFDYLKHVVHENFRKRIKLFGDHEIVCWGEKSFMSEKVIDQAVREYLNGMQPWHCQICGKRECYICGQPIAWLAYGDYAYHETRGYYSKGANLGASPPCINPECKKYRDLSQP